MLVGGRNIATFGPQFAKYTPYQRAQVQRYQMKIGSQKTLATLQQYSSGFFGASLTMANGLSKLAAQAAILRSQDVLTAKQTELKNTIDISA